MAAIVTDSLRKGNALMAEETNRIRALNDAFRTTLQGGTLLMTSGVQALPQDMVEAALKAMTADTSFNEDNDPYGEHDFGSFKIEGRSFFWKIDYYDKTMEFGSDNAADPEKTSRVLTLMLAQEY